MLGRDHLWSGHVTAMNSLQRISTHRQRHWGAEARETWKLATCFTQTESKISKVLTKERVVSLYYYHICSRNKAGYEMWDSGALSGQRWEVMISYFQCVSGLLFFLQHSDSHHAPSISLPLPSRCAALFPALWLG